MNAIILTSSDKRLFRQIMGFEDLEEFQKVGLYTVRLFKNLLQSYFITLDDRLPSIENTNGERIPLFARSPDDL